MNVVQPETPADLARTLADAAGSGRAIRCGGNFTKDKIAGPLAAADVTISTAGLRRVLHYEPRDLTISVEAGLPYAEFRRLLAGNRQMVPLDPPFAETATVGGVVAANHSGPRRRLFGSARDFVIGMTFATLEGKLVQSGGMVVKNVAGLDMGKLMIGSFGTLAAIAVVNFKLVPMPPASRTFAMQFPTAAAVIDRRNQILSGVLQPVALDIVSPRTSALLGLEGFALLLQATGNPAVIDRYSRELPDARTIERDEEQLLWEKIREYTPEFIAREPAGAIARVSVRLSDLRLVLESAPVEAVARAGNGVCYVYLPNSQTAAQWSAEAQGRGWRYALEYSTTGLDRWPNPGSDFEMMVKVKEMFDPQRLLNRGRLYGRI
ncbi:MAG TPA: FAD-binding protein [Bryobacteraceae bacterium]|nr:FAD-binding protein [Bryobacteraceae bacterium]